MPTQQISNRDAYHETSLEVPKPRRKDDPACS